MIIDSLTHILPEEISKNLNQFKTLDSIFNDFFDKNTKIVQAEQLINQMKKNGINKSVTAGFGWTNHELAILVNDYILLSKKQFPEEIIPFCSLDINSKKSEEELLRCISKGVKGIGELHINNLENILDNKIFTNILKIALHYNLPIITTRTSNLYGPGQLNFSALVPSIIMAALFAESELELREIYTKNSKAVILEAI